MIKEIDEGTFLASPPAEDLNPYVTFSMSEADMVTPFVGTLTPRWMETGTMQYSLDTTTWTTIPATGTALTANAEGKIYIRGNFPTNALMNNTGSPSPSNKAWTTSAPILRASGNVIYLLRYSSLSPTLTLGPYAFYCMFTGITALIQAPSLPKANVTLANNCYDTMFSSTRIIKAPDLPATVGAANAYLNMFQYNPSLIIPPKILPLTSIGNSCCQNMFNNCTALKTAPQLPCNNLSGGSSVYASMFNGCTSLVIAPALPAATLGTGCYSYLFNGCSSLVTPPTLAAVGTLPQQAYYSMFAGCTSLVNAPVLPATGIQTNTYVRTYEGCTSLKVVAIRLNTTPPTNSVTNMFVSVGTGGTLYCDLSTTDLPTPAGWARMPYSARPY